MNLEFFSEEFSADGMTLTRGDLECLPSPIMTSHLTDGLMQMIVDCASAHVRDRFRVRGVLADYIANGHPDDDPEIGRLNGERAEGCWWEYVELYVSDLLNMDVYYEDIEADKLKNCGGCEGSFLIGDECPICGSGNWVFGMIDE